MTTSKHASGETRWACSRKFWLALWNNRGSKPARHVSQIRRFTFSFVPSHTGVRGTERTSQLALSAVVEEGQPMDTADIISDVRETSLRKDTCETAALSGMKELRVTFWVAGKKNERSNKSSRRMARRQRRDVISYCKLRGIMKRWSEHLWMRPERNDGPTLTMGGLPGC